MSVYLHAVIRANPGMQTALVDLLKGELIPIMEAGGWKLVACLTGMTGPNNTVIDIWELEDLEHFQRAYDGLRAHPDYPSIRERLDLYVRDEEIRFCARQL